MQLPADTLVELGCVDAVSDETVHRTLKKNDLKPWQTRHRYLPGLSGEFVARMEDVLDLYDAAPGSRRPVVCLDERPLMLHAHAWPPSAEARHVS